MVPDVVTERTHRPGTQVSEPGQPTHSLAAMLESTALLTDQYELTMLAGALAEGSAQRRCSFEVFARRLPEGRRYGVVVGTGRVLDAISRFRFSDAQLATLEPVLDARTLDRLADYRFTGDVEGYPEGELYFSGSPVLTVTGLSLIHISEPTRPY